MVPISNVLLHPPVHAFMPALPPACLPHFTAHQVGERPANKPLRAQSRAQPTDAPPADILPNGSAPGPSVGNGYPGPSALPLPEGGVASLEARLASQNERPAPGHRGLAAQDSTAARLGGAMPGEPAAALVQRQGGSLDAHRSSSDAVPSDTDTATDDGSLTSPHSSR